MEKRFFYSNSYESFVGLLNLYPGADIAISLRKLDTNYNGPSIKVRRSPDNQELDIYFLSNGQLDITALMNFVGLGNGWIVKWYDQSGNNNHLVQNIAIYQPYIINNGVLETDNGKPAIRFYGNFYRLNLTNQIFLSLINTSYTVQHRLTNSVCSIGINGETTSRPTTPIIYIDNLLYNNAQDGVVVKYYYGTINPSTINTFNLISNISSDSSSVLRVNSNNLTLTGPSFLSNPINTHLLSLGSYGNSNINSRISEIILYQNTKSLTDNLQIENNINTYYGIY